MQINPYLNFDGQCAEAFRFYQQVFGGTMEVMMTHGESPICDEVPAEWHERILHARLVIDGTVLMGSDCPPNYYEKPTSITVALQVEDTARAERIFHALAEGGQVTMPFEKSFWADRFGMVTDKYGIPWMINGAPLPASELQGA